MGAWGTGAFDNDGAGDFLAELRHADVNQRETVIVQALQAATAAEDYLEVDDGQAAIAAAAVTATARTGRHVTDTDSGTGLATTDLPHAHPELVALAVRALDRVTGENSEWRELWEESDALDEALHALADIRAALA